MLDARPAELAWLAALVALAAYETFALASGRMTLSRYVWTIQRWHYGPLLPFLAGLVCGHFFWSGQ